MERRESLRLNFTKKALDSLPVDKRRRMVYHDTHAHGLCLRVEPTGKKSFCWLRKVNGRATFKPIGTFPDLTVENARTKAGEHNALFARWKADDYRGADPFTPPRRDLTLSAVLDDYIERHLKTSAKNPGRSTKGARWQFERYVPPSWKNRPLDGVQKHHVLDLYKNVKRDPGLFTANRLVQLLKALFNWAENEMDWHGENPARRFKLESEKQHQRSRFLEADEVARLLTALSAEPSRNLQHFVVLALFTMARMGDVLSMRWENVSLETNTWLIPNPKSRVPYFVPLLPEAIEILQQRPRTSPWVFPGVGTTGHLTGFKHSWPALLKRAKLTNFRIHDLRRTLPSWMASSGASLPIIGKALGHQSLGATPIYARIQAEAARRAMADATKAMLTAGKKAD